MDNNLDILEIYNYVDNNFFILEYYFYNLFNSLDTDDIKKNKIFHFLVFYKLFRI